MPPKGMGLVCDPSSMMSVKYRLPSPDPDSRPENAAAKETDSSCIIQRPGRVLPISKTRGC